MLLVQIVLYCLLYALFVKCAAKDSGLNCLYFYPNTSSPGITSIRFTGCST